MIKHCSIDLNKFLQYFTNKYRSDTKFGFKSCLSRFLNLLFGVFLVWVYKFWVFNDLELDKDLCTDLSISPSEFALSWFSTGVYNVPLTTTTV